KSSGAECERNRRRSSKRLRPGLAAELACHQPGQNYRDRSRNRREEPESSQRGSKQLQRYPPEERSHRRIGDVTPCKVPGVVRRRQLVAMKTITPAGQQMNNQNSRAKRE